MGVDNPDCQHESKRLVEGGYERYWTWVEPDDEGDPVAVFHGLEDFTDDGDGNYRLECAYCLAVLELPDEWDWD
jgi:hypothetical protein